MCQINLARCQTHKIITRTKTNWAKEVCIDTNTKQIGNHGNIVHALRYVHVQWTTYRILGNFHWCKSTQTLQKKFSRFFIFAECGMLWLHPYQLMWHFQIISFGFVGILYSRRLILLYSNHLEGRQTVENHLVHMGTRCTHINWHNDVINFHLSSFFFFFIFIFTETGLTAKIRKIWTQ